MTTDNNLEIISLVDKRSGPGGAGTPRDPDHEGMCFMAKERILQNAVSDEARRTVLREAEERYRHELMDEEEHQLLLDRIKRLRGQLGLMEVR